ncbi:MAG: carboxypeptidase-like regulatory domain-containing protein [Acidobacteriota bacterium]
MHSRFLWVACVLFTPIALWGQGQSGGSDVRRHVSDPAGAAISNAKVIATQTTTNVVRETETTGQGLYTFSSLAAGPYELRVEAAGFKASKRDGITLTVGAMATVDVKLDIGAASEVVTVTAEAPIVETTRSQTSTVVDSRSVSELPINGRNFLDFTVLTPGVVKDPTRGGRFNIRGPARHVEQPHCGWYGFEQRVLRTVDGTRGGRDAARTASARTRFKSFRYRPTRLRRKSGARAAVW